MREMSSQTRKLEIIPARAPLIRHARHVYGRRRCDKRAGEDSNRSRSKGAYAEEGGVGFGGAMSEKFVESTPLYWIEKRFERMEI